MFVQRVISEDKTLAPSSAHFLNRIVVSMRHMQKLINDTIMYMQSNPLEEKFKNTDLGFIAKKSLAELSDVIKAHGANVSVEPLPEAKVLPDQIKQLFTSLIMNAITYAKADEQAEVIIKPDAIESGELEEIEGVEHKYIKINVSDNGQGFETSKANKIFEPFFRLHNKDNIPGGGLGLTLCKKIITNHKGYIKATGKLNQGCRIDLYFPK